MNDTQNNQDVQKINDELNTILEEAKQLSASMDEKKKRAEERLDVIEADVDKSVQKIDEITGNLDVVEKEAGKELDELMMKQSEEIAVLGQEDEQEDAQEDE